MHDDDDDCLLFVTVAFLHFERSSSPLPLEQAIALSLLLPPVIVNEIIYKNIHANL